MSVNFNFNQDSAVHLNIDCDVNELLDNVDHKFSGKAINDRTYPDGSRFISCMEDGEVLAAYNHPTDWHSAKADGGLFGKVAESEKPPGEWAVAIASAGILGRKTSFDNW